MAGQIGFAFLLSSLAFLVLLDVEVEGGVPGQKSQWGVSFASFHDLRSFMITTRLANKQTDPINQKGSNFAINQAFEAMID